MIEHKTMPAASPGWIVPPVIYGVEVALSVVGAAIAGTLWWAHRANIELPCTSSGGCDQVNASQWAHVSLGPLHAVPIALVGFISYLVLLTLAMAKIGTDNERMRRQMHWPFWLLTAIGAGYSWYLQYVAHFLIGAFCVWCFSSAVIMALLFLVATYESVCRQRRSRAHLSETSFSAHV